MARKVVETVSTGCKPLRSSKAFNRRKQVDDKKCRSPQETRNEIDANELPGDTDEVHRLDYATISALVSSDNIGPNPPLPLACRDVSPTWKSPPPVYDANGRRVRMDREKMPPSCSDLKLAKLLSNAHRAPLANRNLSRPTWSPSNGTSTFEQAPGRLLEICSFNCCPDLSSFGAAGAAGYDLKGLATFGSPYVRRPAKGLPTARSSFDVQSDQGKHRQVHEEIFTANSKSTRSEGSGTAYRSASFIQKLSGLAYGRCGDPCHACLGTDNEAVQKNTGSISSVEVFRKAWKKTSKDSNSRFELLRRVAPCDLPRIFKDEIPVSLLGEILETLWDWQLTLVRLSSPEVGVALEQTPSAQVVEPSVFHPKKGDQAPSQSGQRFVDEFGENAENVVSRKSITSLDKLSVAMDQCPAAIPYSNATSRSSGKNTKNTKATVPPKPETAQLSRTRRGWNQMNHASPAGSGEETASQAASEKAGLTTATSSEWLKDTVGNMSRRQYLPKNGIQQLIIQPCENLRKFDEVLSRFGILNQLPHDDCARDLRQPAVIAPAKVTLDPTCAPSRNSTLSEAVLGDVSVQIQDLKFDGREYLDGFGSLGADEQHGSQNSTGHTSARSVSFQTEDHLSTAGTEQHPPTTARAHIVWLFDVLKAITKCGRFPLALKLMGEKARFIVATLLDHFAAGILFEPRQELPCVDSAEGISTEQEVSDKANIGSGRHSHDGPLDSITSQGVPLDSAPRHGARTRFPVEQLKELRTLYRIDMQ